MIELQIKGPKNRTVINSLKCQILKQKDKFFLMRFKSLPINKKHSRNSLCIDMPHTVKKTIQSQQRQYFEKANPKRQDFLNLSEIKIHKRLWTEQQQKFFLSAEHKYLSKSQFNTYDKDENSIQSIRKKAKTIQAQQEESQVECSLRNYIRRHLSFKQQNLKRDAEQVKKLSIHHSQQVNSLKKIRNLRNSPPKKQQKVEGNSLQDLLEGILSPNLCRLANIKIVRKGYNLKNEADELGDVKMFKKASIHEKKHIQNELQYKGLGNKINSASKSPIKKSLKKIQLKNTGAFKYSIGPWRNSGFGGFNS